MRIQLMSAAAAGYIGFAKHKWAALEELRKSSGVVAMQKFIDTGEVRIFLRCGVDPLIRLEGDPKEHALWLLPSSDSATGDATLASAPKTTWRKGRMKGPVAGVLDWKGFYKKDKDGVAYWTEGLSWDGAPCRYTPGVFGTKIYRNGDHIATTPYTVYGAALLRAQQTTWIVAACRDGADSSTDNFGVKLYRKTLFGDSWEEFYTFQPPDGSYNATNKPVYDKYWDGKSSKSRPLRFPWLFSGGGTKAVTHWPLEVTDNPQLHFVRPMETSIDTSEDVWQVTTRWLKVEGGLIVTGGAAKDVVTREGTTTETLTVADDNESYVVTEPYSRDRTLVVNRSMDISMEAVVLVDFKDTLLVALVAGMEASLESQATQTYTYDHDTDEETPDTQSFGYTATGSYSGVTTLNLICDGEPPTTMHTITDSESYTISASSARSSDLVGRGETYMLDGSPETSSLSASEAFAAWQVVQADLRHSFVVLRTSGYAETESGSNGLYQFVGDVLRWTYTAADVQTTGSEAYKFFTQEWSGNENVPYTYQTSGFRKTPYDFGLAILAEGEAYSTTTPYEDSETSLVGVSGGWGKLWHGFLTDKVFALNGTVVFYDYASENRAISRYQPDNLPTAAPFPAGDNPRYRPIGVAGYMPRNKI